MRSSIAGSDSCPPKFGVLGTYTVLSSIRGCSTGPDLIPLWLLSNMAHLLAEPITYLFNLSLQNFSVPDQWRSSCITPTPKIPCPATEADYRPISIMPVLCRLLEKLVVRLYIYPTLTNHELNRPFADQFAFRSRSEERR